MDRSISTTATATSADETFAKHLARLAIDRGDTDQFGDLASVGLDLLLNDPSG
jgi:hypothetical protein